MREPGSSINSLRNVRTVPSNYHANCAVTLSLLYSIIFKITYELPRKKLICEKILKKTVSI